MLDFTKLDIKKKNKETNKHQINTIITQATIRDAVPESYQVRPESLETFQPTNSKVKNENDAIRNQISDFDKRRISQPKIQQTN